MDSSKYNYLDGNIKSISNDLDTTFRPKLVAPGVKYFFKSILRECHNYKQRNTNLVYNISMLLLFACILGVILFTKYKGNKTSEDMYLKALKDKQYIMSKLVYYNRQNLEQKQKMSNDMITNLPDFSTFAPL